MKSILIIDDEINICTLLSKFLSKHGFKTDSTMTGAQALKMMKEEAYDLVLCDYRLKDTDGAQLLNDIRALRPQTVVIIITGYSDVRIAVEMVKNGAYDYISKPLYPDEILSLVNKALSQPAPSVQGTPVAPYVHEERTPQHSEPGKNGGGKYVYGESEPSKELFRELTLVAPTDYSVILFGETGTGKESVAHLIHDHSSRSNQPFIAIDCGSLSKELAASELFGHEKGAFTGAINTKIGAFEQAHGGTIFLDEIANLSYDIQVALLRVIQEKQIRRVGSMKEIAVDTRLIVASNENLFEAVQKGKFREDLFHRFNEFTIHIPPLRVRNADLPLFVDSFLSQVSKELNKPEPVMTEEVWECFRQYDWPGNIRELKNVIRRASLLTPAGKEITMAALPLEMKAGGFSRLNSSAMAASAGVAEDSDDMPDLPMLDENDLKSVALKAEYNKIINVLKAVKYNKTKAAQLLNIDRKTLYNKLRLLNINY
ncbi:sigma-54-dependent transcriptional regulator [Chitinophaga barathri]|uniref:Sigma-54-dependent Fis family transcriptional regulator n=1 Tax=Chitinophaga barathri TaxID=1647451 RepID=A0A3N4M5L5_9BACT|nr:sigma-54 dependent transcriptional regulator [Chitinophaga barathri]RPD38532.1 sigma-54-dependent Fis family transcriptional regulator [Chitinophaga barathri]